MLGHHRHASETPFKWRFAGGDEDGRLKVVIGPSLHSSNPSLVLVQPRKTRIFITERVLMGRKETNQTKISPHQLKKNVVKFGPPLTKLFGSKHERTLFSVTNKLCTVKNSLNDFKKHDKKTVKQEACEHVHEILQS